MRKFICRRCGKCCTDIGGRFSQREADEIKKAFESLERYGIKLVLSPEEFSIPLSPEEKNRLEKLAIELGIDFSPKPKLILKRSNKTEILEWDLGSRSCPFYSNHKCLVYKDRPLACKSFPVILKPHGFELLDICPEAKRFSPDEIEKAFPEESRYAREFSARIMRIKENLKGNLT